MLESKIISKNLLCSRGNYIQYPVITYNGKEFEQEYTIYSFYYIIYFIHICCLVAELCLTLRPRGV